MEYYRRKKTKVDITLDPMFDDKSPHAKLRKIKTLKEREHALKRNQKMQNIINGFKKVQQPKTDRNIQSEFNHDVESFQYELKQLTTFEGQRRSNSNHIIEYIKLQNEEVQKIKNQQKLPTLNMLSPHHCMTDVSERSLLTCKRVNEISDTQSLIPVIKPYFQGRTMCNFLKKIYNKKKVPIIHTSKKVQDLILDLENQRVNLNESHRRYELSEDEHTKRERLHSFNPKLQNEGIEYYVLNHKYDQSFQMDPISIKKHLPEFRSSTYSKFSHGTIDQPINIQRVKDKLLYDVIRQKSDNPAFDPLRLQFFSLSKQILQYQRTKSIIDRSQSKDDKNQKTDDIIQKSDTNRKDSLMEKFKLYNTGLAQLNASNLKNVRKNLNKSLDERINLNGMQKEIFMNIIAQLKISEGTISNKAKEFMENIRVLMLYGKSITSEDMELLKQNLQIDENDQIVNMIFQKILDAKH